MPENAARDAVRRTDAEDVKAVYSGALPNTLTRMVSTLASEDKHPAFARRLPLTRAALAFADERHAGQRREADDAPFVTHPIEVASLLNDAGYPDHVIAAGALHDVIEDTDTEPREISDRFGSKVALLVTAVTDNPSIEDKAERKAALRSQVARAGEEAVAVFAADKISKARELRLRGSRERFDSDTRAKIEHYEASLEMLEELMPGHAFVDQLRTELEAVRALPANTS
jgi:(p)ppGpp synthase/HD superfamily hydrolase